MDESVLQHYSSEDIAERILEGLTAIGKDIHHLSVGDLAAVDEFHLRGRETTVELSEMVDFHCGDRVLDMGCGIGGSARYLAERFGVRVTGVDLTPEFVEAAGRLSQVVGVEGMVDFLVGSAVELPFEDGAFDCVWTEHVQMNIAEKSQFYGEAARVLKTGGKFAFHDIFSGDGSTLHFPVPWAEQPAISHLVSIDTVQLILKGLGFVEVEFRDQTERSLEWAQASVGRLLERGLPPLGLSIVMGETMIQKLQNLTRNLEEGKVRVGMAVYELR